MAPEASAVLGDALKIIERNSYYSDRVDWESVRASAVALAKNARDASDTYPSIRYALEQLQDPHSFLVSHDRIRSLVEDAVSASSKIRSEPLGRVGYVSLPGIPGVASDAEEEYVKAVRGRLEAMDSSGVCGWIIDLRNNHGGNMIPMLSGLAPIIGEGAMLQWYLRPSWATEYLGVSRLKTAWTLERPSKLASANAPVALIAGRNTKSAGELVLIAFHGRKSTRVFGEPTAGKASGNAGYALSDGSMVFMTAALAADRGGRVFDGPIQPDESIELSYEVTVDLHRDQAVSAARGWIKSIADCGASVGTNGTLNSTIKDAR